MKDTIEEQPFSEAAPPRPRDADYWARRSAYLTVSARELPVDALNLNVQGRQLAGPMQGFGQFWQKTYRARLLHTDVSPAELIATWKANFQHMWPQGNRFFAPLTGIKPGEVGLINASMPGRVRLSTGVMVLYADEDSFTLMTPQGHVFAGWITFCSWRDEEGLTVQVQVQMRGSDPAFEIGLMLFGHQEEDRFWTQTIRNVAAYFDNYPEVEIRRELVDPGRQWQYVGNIRYNAFIRSMLWDMSRPIRWVAKSIRS